MKVEIIIANNSKDYSDEIEKFEKYLESFKIFPSNINKILLFRYLKRFDFDYKQAKELLEYNLRFRQKHSNLFYKRDIYSVETQSVLDIVHFVQIPKFTKDNIHITIMWLNNSDVSKFNIIEMFRWLFITFDAGMTNNVIANGEIALTDCKGFTIRHLFKAIRSMPSLIAALKYIQDAVPAQVLQNHYINCSPIFVRFLDIVKPFVRKEHQDNMHVHTNNYDTLYKFVPRELLPFEYGGTIGSIEDMYKKDIDFFSKFNDYVKNDNNWKLLE